MLVLISTQVAEASGCLGCFAEDSLAQVLHGTEHRVFASALGQAACESCERTVCNFCEPSPLHGSTGTRQAALAEAHGEIWLLPDYNLTSKVH